jgi:hypothetical protein
MLPGLTVLLAAGASHPSWFRPVYFSSPWYLLVFAAIAVLAGNTWYVFHRYSLHQFIDWIIYLAKRPGKGDYLKWFTSHVYRSLRFKTEDRRVQDHAIFRSAQVIFIFITCEVALLFSWGAEVCTFYWKHACAIRIAAAVGLLVAVIQYFISYKLDVYFIEQCVGDKPE